MPGNARRGRPQGKCHRKQTACTAVQARVKGCGKSAPPRWQQGGHGKPHREQNQIGMADSVFTVRSVFGSSSGLVARGVQQWASQMNDHRLACFCTPRYRTRLTGHLTFSSFLNLVVVIRVLARCRSWPDNNDLCSTNVLIFYWLTELVKPLCNPHKPTSLLVNPVDPHDVPWYPIMSRE